MTAMKVVPVEYGRVDMSFIPSPDTPQKRGALPTVTVVFGVEDWAARDNFANALAAGELLAEAAEPLSAVEKPAPDGPVERWDASSVSHQNEGGIWSAGIDDSSIWGHRIQVHADTIEEAEALRDQVLAALTSRAAVLEDSWIAVSERLPDCEHCYCVIGCDSVGNVLPCEFWPDEQEFWPVNGKGEHWGDKYADITYWRELPAPPAIRAAKGE